MGLERRGRAADPHAGPFRRVEIVAVADLNLEGWGCFEGSWHYYVKDPRPLDHREFDLLRSACCRHGEFPFEVVPLYGSRCREPLRAQPDPKARRSWCLTCWRIVIDAGKVAGTV